VGFKHGVSGVAAAVQDLPVVGETAENDDSSYPENPSTSMSIGCPAGMVIRVTWGKLCVVAPVAIICL
jgi:hypothetical protein